MPPPPKVRSKPRDRQASRVYDAEERVRRKLPGYRLDFDLPSTEAISSWAHRVIRSEVCDVIRDSIKPLVVRHHGWNRFYKQVQVTSGQGTKAAWCEGNTLILPRWARNRLTVCHELAHILLWFIEDWIADHGEMFCGVYLTLVREHVAPDVGDVLAESFIKEGVSVLSL